MSLQSEIATRADFAAIRYAQCWEDADVLLEALELGPADTCLSIASAGDNTLALVGAGVKRVLAVDLSPAQIACLELRVSAYRSLEYGEFLELLGQAPSKRRHELYRRCRSGLSQETRSFWDANARLIDAGFAQVGKFERYLSAFRRFVLPLIHGRDTVNELFALETTRERREFYDRRWNNRRWSLVCRAFFSHLSLGNFGRDPSFTRYADEPVWHSLERRIPNALVVQRPAENPYLQWILSGSFVSALPYALRAENFDRIRDNLGALEWRCAPLEQVLRDTPDASVDGCNLSDIFEYMARPAYERLLGELVRVGAPGCRLVYWNVVVDRHRPPSMRHVLNRLDALASDLHARDKAFFYRNLAVEEVI